MKWAKLEYWFLLPEGKGNKNYWDSDSSLPVSLLESIGTKYFRVFLCKMAGDEGGSRVLDVFHLELKTLSKSSNYYYE